LSLYIYTYLYVFFFRISLIIYICDTVAIFLFNICHAVVDFKAKHTILYF